ncbi:fumarate hydratase [Shigella flexneri]
MTRHSRRVGLTSNRWPTFLRDPEASETDKHAALQFCATPTSRRKVFCLTCQDTGTAIIVGKKGQRVWTGGCDEAVLARGVITHIPEIPRYSRAAGYV